MNDIPYGHLRRQIAKLYEEKTILKDGLEAVIAHSIDDISKAGRYPYELKSIAKRYLDKMEMVGK